jgi:hypothetical protein
MKREWIQITILCGVLAVAVVWFRLGYNDSTSPVQSIHSDWRATIAISTNQPIVQLAMSGDVLDAQRQAPAYIPLFPRETVFRNLTMNGKPLNPIKRNDWFFAEVTKSGDYDISAELVIKPTHDRGEHSLRFTKPQFVTSTVTIDSDQAYDVHIPGITDAIAGTTSNGTHGDLTIGSLNDVNVVWRTPRPDIAQIGTASVEPFIVWTIHEKILSANAILETTIEGGSTSKMKIDLPEGSDNIQLEGGHVRDHRVDGRELTIFFKGVIADRTSMRLSFDMPRPDGHVLTCPMIEVRDGRIDTGGSIMIVKDVPGILLEQKTDGLTPISDLDLPKKALGLTTGKPSYIYRTTSRQSGPIFDLVTTTPFPLVETIADKAEMLTIIRPGGEEITRVIYDIRNNAKQFLKMNLPEGSKILFARVDNITRKISTDGEYTLIPLAKSVQTLGGLVPFPLEIVYCRQSKAASKDGAKLVDLPELIDIPTALVNVTVMCPQDTSPRNYQTRLKMVSEFSVQGNLWWSNTHSSNDKTNSLADTMDQDLAHNYYQAGYEAYRDNNFETAETYLTKVKELAPNSGWQKNANDLLGNILAGRGEVTTTDRMQRARISKIRDELTADNPKIASEQERLIQGGLANIEDGDEELGLELLEEASRLAKQLTQRSDSEQRQKAISRKYEYELEEAKKDMKKNEALNDELKSLQKEAQQVATSDNPAQPQSRLAFASTLANSARSASISLDEIQDAAFGYVSGKQVPTPGKVSKKAKARKYSKGSYGKSPKVSKSGRDNRKRRGSVKERNLKLASKVSILRKAVTAANSTDAYVPQPSSVSPNQLAAIETIKGKISEADKQVDQLLLTLEQKEQGVASMEDIQAAGELTKLDAWNDANMNTWGTLDGSANTSFSKLKNKLQQAKAVLTDARSRREQADRIVFDVSDIVDSDSINSQQSFQRFLTTNSYVVPEGDDFQFEVSGGKMTVGNYGANPDMLNSAIENWRANDGQVVPVAGLKVNFSGGTTNSSILGKTFSNTTTSGKRYAVLDEAEYRTLIQSADVADGNAPTEKTTKRKVIVGTDNRVADVSFSILQSDADYNGIQIDQTTVNLPNDKYLAIDNGDHVSVLRTGAVRDWQEDASEIDLTAPTPYSVDLPEIGTALRFEKMLLAAGESPDIQMTL